MILVVGGHGQGQEAYARMCLKEFDEQQNEKNEKNEKKAKREREDRKQDGTLGTKKVEIRIADGETDDAPGEAIGADLVLNLHAFVRKVMEAGEDPREFVTDLLHSAPRAVTIDEVGCGIVPIDAFERRYRDEAGMAGQRFAAQADQVVRMICGIPQRIR